MNNDSLGSAPSHWAIIHQQDIIKNKKARLSNWYIALSASTALCFFMTLIVHAYFSDKSLVANLWASLCIIGVSFAHVIAYLIAKRLFGCTKSLDEEYESLKVVDPDTYSEITFFAKSSVFVQSYLADVREQHRSLYFFEYTMLKDVLAKSNPLQVP